MPKNIFSSKGEKDGAADQVRQRVTVGAERAAELNPFMHPVTRVKTIEEKGQNGTDHNGGKLLDAT